MPHVLTVTLAHVRRPALLSDHDDCICNRCWLTARASSGWKRCWWASIWSHYQEVSLALPTLTWLTGRRTGRYKLLTLGGVAFGCLGYGLTILRWHGHTSWAESLYIFPGGFATGVVQSTMFIALTAGVSREDYAAAGSGFYQATGIGGSMATCVTMAILQATLRPALRIALSAKDGKDEVSIGR